jgi:hypothetical protein
VTGYLFQFGLGGFGHLRQASALPEFESDAVELLFFQLGDSFAFWNVGDGQILEFHDFSPEGLPGDFPFPLLHE